MVTTASGKEREHDGSRPVQAHTSRRAATLRPLATIRAFRRDPLGLFKDIAELPDGMARTTLPGLDLTFITHPSDVHHILQENHQNYNKDALIYKNARPFLGDGLPVTPGGADWRVRRRAVQPSFHQQHLSTITDATEHYLQPVLATWQQHALSGEPLDVDLDMSELTMRVACKLLFDLEVTSTTTVVRDFKRASAFAVEFLTRPFPPLFVPTRRNRAFHAAMRNINTVVAEVVSTRAADPTPRQDVLEILTGVLGGAEPEDMTPQHLRDELIALFFAGHETTASTLSWCWHLLAQHPEFGDRLDEELTSVLGGRPATLADLPDLTYTKMVVEESMRLYPVVWCGMRRALDADVIAGHDIAAGAQLMWSPYVGNRHPDFWDAPDAFRPERFDPDQHHDRPRHAVVPFGAGPRVCIGTQFAMAESCLTIATLAQHFRVTPVADRPTEIGTDITLHPKNGLWVLQPRGGTTS